LLLDNRDLFFFRETEAMAEILGIFSATLTIAELSIEVARLLYKVADEAGSAADEIKSFASIVSSFHPIVTLALVSLEQHRSNDTNSKEVRAIMDDSSIKDGLEQQSVHIGSCLRNVKEKLQQLSESKLNWWKKVVWIVWRKPDVLELIPLMESMKSNLVVVLGVLNLQITSQEGVTRETQLVSFLKLNKYSNNKSFRNCVEVMLREAVFGLRREVATSNTIVSPNVGSSVASGQSALIGHASHLVDGNQENKRRRKRRSSVFYGTSRTLSMHGNDSNKLHPRRKSRTSSHSEDSVEHSTQNSHSGSKKPDKTKTTPDISKLVPQVTPQTHGEARSSPSHRNSKANGSLISQENILKVDSLDQTFWVQGQIVTSQRRVNSTIYLEDNSNQNYISRAFAEQLNLDIKTVNEDEEPVFVEYEDCQRERCFGKVELQWQWLKVPNDGRATVGIPMEAEAFVCENLCREESILVLGKSFPGKQHYVRDYNGHIT
jgi:hypothetical protein